MLPRTTTVPVPLGARSSVALEVVTMSLPLRSRFPPNCGVLSSATLEIALEVARPDTTVLLETFFNPPPEVSSARNTSSLAIVLISDRLPIVLPLASRMFNSAAVAVTPSRMFSSAVVAVTPSIRFSSAVVAVTPSMILSSAAVAEIAVPL